MERRNKEKVTFESHGTKHESNRIAFSLMSYGLESSWAFIPQHLQDVGGNLENAGYLVLSWMKGRGRDTRTEFQVKQPEVLPASFWRQQDTRRAQLHLRFPQTQECLSRLHASRFPSCASLTISIFLFVSIDLYLFSQSNKGVITSPQGDRRSLQEEGQIFPSFMGPCLLE